MAQPLRTLRRRLGRTIASPVRRATLGTVLTGLVGQVVLAVSGVIAVRMLGPEDRGYLALLVLVPLIVAKLGGLGIPLALTYHVARDRSATAGIWAKLWPLVLFQCGLLAGLHAIMLWALLENDPSYVLSASLVTLVLVPAALAQDYGLATLQGKGRFLAFNVLRQAPAVVYAAALVVLLLLDLDSLGEVAVAWSGANALLGALTLTVALRHLGEVLPERAPRIRGMVAFGAKGLLGSNSPIEYYRLDQAVVGLFLTPVALGLYVAALAFTNLPRFISTSVGMVAYPHVASVKDPAVAKRKLWRFFTITVAACLAVVVALELTAGVLVPFFFGEAFRDSIDLVRILLVSALLIAARRILADGARGLGLPTLGTVAEVVSLLTLAPALPLCISRWGVEGVAIALVIAGATSLVVMLVGILFATRRSEHPAEAPEEAEPVVPEPLVPEPSRGPRVRRPAFGAPLRDWSLWRVAVVALAVDAVAVAAVVLWPVAAAAGAVIACSGLTLVAMRRRLRATPVEEDVAPADEPPGAEDRDLALARAFYYAGCVMVGFLVLRPAAGVTVSDLLFFGALGLAALAMVAGRRQVPVFMGSALFIGVVLFGVGGFLSSFSADSPFESVLVVARVVYLTLIWFALGTVLLTKPAHLRAAMACWVGSAALGGAGAIVQTLFGDVIPGGDVHFGRVSGFVYQVNDLGGLCAVAALPAAMLVTQARTLAGRAASIGALLLIVAGILLSSSVSGAVAVAGAGAVWLALASRRIRVLVPLAAAILVLTTFAAANNRYYESPLERFGTASSNSGTADATLQTRIDSYEAAWDTIQSSPVVGVGLTREGADTPTGLAVHNLFLAAWYQAGLFGLIGVLLVAGSALAAGWKAMLAARSREERATAQALFAAVLAFLLFAQAQPTLFQRYGWISVAMVIALRGLQLRSAAAARADAPARADAGLARVAAAT